RLLILSPCQAVRTGFKIQFPHPGVLGEQMEKALTGDIFGLGISHFFFRDLFERINGMGRCTSVLEAGTAPSPSAYKHPYIALRIHGQTWIVMWIIHSLLIIHHSWLADLLARMVIA